MGEKRKAADGGLPNRNRKNVFSDVFNYKGKNFFRKGGEKCHIKN